MRREKRIGRIFRRASRHWQERLQELRFAKGARCSDDTRLWEVFLDTNRPVLIRFEHLFPYFVSGFLHYCTPFFSKAMYPGAPSRSGYAVDALEGFSRVAPMLAAWIRSGCDPTVAALDGRQSVDLPAILAEGLSNGADPHSTGFWGGIGDHDGRIVEAADIALTLWLLRDTVWPRLDARQQDNLVRWLKSVEDRQVFDNNWQLFPVLVSAVLRSLGRGAFEADTHYERLKTFYKGNGWFSDGPGDAYDYYNAWGIHYTLYWIDRVTPGYDGAFINSALNDSADNFKCLFSPAGYPITGRSICYRVGAPVPLVMAATGPAGRIGPGLARRDVDCTWCHFVERGAVRYGALTQGYWHQDLRFLDNYSGPASPLWSLRSLVPAFLAPPEAPFWRAPEEALPVERVSYAISLPEIRWEIHGDHETGEVCFVKLDNEGNGWRRPDKVALKDRLSGFIPGGTRRPESNYLKYELYEYNALKPFCIVEAHAEHDSGSS